MDNHKNPIENEKKRKRIGPDNTSNDDLDDETCLQASFAAENITGLQMEQIKIHLSKVDLEKKLSIHNLLKYYHKDPLVQEYVSILLKSNLMPVILDESKREEILQASPQIHLTNQELLPAMINWMTYMQSTYFTNNIRKATANDIGLFNPKYSFSIPSFNLLPSYFHENIHLLKKDFVNSVQLQAIIGSEFLRELMILRIYNSILEALHKNTIVNGNQLNDLVLFYTYLSHKCSQIEFMHKYNIKDINWAERTTKVKETLPGWRKNPNGSPPTIPINFYAKNLILNINRLDLDPNVLESRFQHQLSKIEELHAQKEAGNEPTISLNSTSIPNSSTAHPLTHGNSVHTDRGLHYETRVPRPPARRQSGGLRLSVHLHIHKQILRI